YRCVRANSESKRQHSDRRESRRFAQHAQRESQILQQRLDKMHAARLAALFLHALHAAKFHTRPPQRLFARNASTYQILSVTFNVRPQLQERIAANTFMSLPSGQPSERALLVTPSLGTVFLFTLLLVASAKSLR